MPLRSAVLLNSGGKDSLAALLLSREEFTLHSVYVHVGQPSSPREAEVAARIAAKYGLDHKVIRVTGGPYDTPSRVLATNPPSTRNVFPFKGIILHSLASMYAASKGIDVVVSGQRADVYPDDFPARLSDALWISRRLRDAPELRFPVKDLSMDEVFEAIRGEPLWAETSYCLEEPPCGGCYGCKLRADWLGRAR